MKGSVKDMLNKKILIAGLFAVAVFMIGAVPVSADMITATNQIPTLKALYHVNDAEANLQNKVSVLNARLNANAGACDVAVAQAEVNEAVMLLNNLNALVARDTMLIGALPVGTPCGPSCYTQALTAQAAWYDYINKAKANQAALSSTYAASIIASNQNALLHQAALAHRYSAGNNNPVSMQATANWAALNITTSAQNSDAMAMTYTPFFRY